MVNSGCKRAGWIFIGLLSFFWALPLVAEEAETCVNAKCHANVAKGEFQHMGTADGACDTCHTEADDSTPYHAGSKHRFEKIIVKDTCGGCHEIDKEKSTLHFPYEEFNCLECHSPHASDQPGILKAPLDTLCSSCHPDVMKGEKGKPKVVHLATNLVKGCGNCHQAHASEHSGLLKAKVKDLCLDCHQREYVLKDRVVKNIAAILNEEGASVHSPVAEGECLGCHNPHIASRKRLLKMDFVVDWYAPRDPKAYALCYDCHDAEAFSTETGEATEFRNGQRNLHYAHLMAEPKGRSCITCHNVHAAKGEHYLDETIPFYGADVPLNFRSTDNGGSCMPACHDLYAYDRENPVDYSDPKTKSATD